MQAIAFYRKQKVLFFAFRKEQRPSEFWLNQLTTEGKIVYSIKTLMLADLKY